MFLLPIGIIIILVLTVILIFNYGKGIIYTLALSKWKSIFLLILFAFFYIIPPTYIEGVDFYIVPYFALAGYLAYLLFKLSFPLKSIFYASVSASVIYLLSKRILPQPIGMIYDPFFIYALALTVLSFFVSYGKRALLFNNAFAVLIFNTLLVINNEYNLLLSPNVFSCICISLVLSYYPVSVITKSTVTGFKRGRIFQTEASESFLLPPKIKKRKKK